MAIRCADCHPNHDRRDITLDDIDVRVAVDDEAPDGRSWYGEEWTDGGWLRYFTAVPCPDCGGSGICAIHLGHEARAEIRQNSVDVADLLHNDDGEIVAYRGCYACRPNDLCPEHDGTAPDLPDSGGVTQAINAVVDNAFFVRENRDERVYEVEYQQWQPWWEGVEQRSPDTDQDPHEGTLPDVDPDL